MPQLLCLLTMVAQFGDNPNIAIDMPIEYKYSMWLSLYRDQDTNSSLEYSNVSCKLEGEFRGGVNGVTLCHHTTK